MKKYMIAAAILFALSALCFTACRKTDGRDMTNAGTVADTTESLGEKLSEAGETVGEKLSQAGETVNEKLSEAGETIGEKLSEAGETISEKLSEAGERLRDGTTATTEGNR